MGRHSINLFMWGYQPHFRFEFESLLNSVLKALGEEDTEGQCLLVGAKTLDSKGSHDVCLEPENGRWPIALFANLPAVIEEHVRNHPNQNIRFSDASSMRDLPEKIRRDSVRRAVKDAMIPYDPEALVRSFVGSPAPIDGYYVVPVLQLPCAIFERHRALREPVSDGYFERAPSLIHAAVFEVLSEAHDELLRPHPGRYSGTRSASADEIARRAAKTFMYTPGVAIGERAGGVDLFERFNIVSSLMYEGTEGKGRIILARLDSGAVETALVLSEPVPFSEPRWARKVLQMASSETALLASTEKILGLGTVSEAFDPWAKQNVFEVQFHDHHHWSISCGDQVMLVSKYGTPSLPRDKFPKARLLDTFARLFPEATAQDAAAFVALFDTAIEQRHGSMLVVAEDATAEAARLKEQGTTIVPTKLTPDLYQRVSNIDGTILIDSRCICHAVGVILDGPANEDCTPSRGARYNSGVRYVAATKKRRLAIVVSDDRTVDVIPILRPRIKSATIEKQVARFEASTVDNYHESLSWLDAHRFYLSAQQCERINAMQERLDSVPLDLGELRVLRETFRPNDGCTEEYFEQ